MANTIGERKSSKTRCICFPIVSLRILKPEVTDRQALRSAKTLLSRHGLSLPEVGLHRYFTKKDNKLRLHLRKFHLPATMHPYLLVASSNCN